MKAIELAWNDPDFRRALRSIMELPQAALDAGFFEVSFQGPRATDEQSPLLRVLGVSVDELDLIATAFRFMHGAARHSSPRAVTDELRGLVEQTPTEFEGVFLEEALPQLESLLGAPEVERARLKESAQHAILPSLESVEFTIDLRIANDEGSALGLVPVVMVRMHFDEPAAAGLRAMWFQIPDHALAQLRTGLAELESSLDAVRLEFQDRLL
jgi:hypothetical protein